MVWGGLWFGEVFVGLGEFVDLEVVCNLGLGGVGCIEAVGHNDGGFDGGFVVLM